MTKVKNIRAYNYDISQSIIKYLNCPLYGKIVLLGGVNLQVTLFYSLTSYSFLAINLKLEREFQNCKD